MQSFEQNIALIHHFFEAYASEDHAAIGNILSPDIRWSIPGRHPLSGVKKGIPEVLEYFAQLGKAEFRASPIVMGANEHYVIDCHLNWSTNPDYPAFKGMSCLLWKIEDGRITEVYNFPENQHEVDGFFSGFE